MDLLCVQPVYQGRIKTIQGNISSVVDIAQIESDILSSSDSILNGKHGEDATWSNYGKYDVLSIVPSLNFIRTDLLPHIITTSGDDPSLYKFKMWINILEHTDGLSRHTHETINHGYLTISNYGSKTIFELGDNVVGYDNLPGQVVHLFGRYFHRVTPNMSNNPRITIAWDIAKQSMDTGNRVYYNL